MRGEAGFMRVISGQDPTCRASALRLGLSAASPFYAAATIVHQGMYRLGLRQRHRLPGSVISVGNLTTGGTGKTPMVCDLVGRLTAAGHHPAVLLRGYAASAAVGSDEAHVLRLELPGIPVEPNPDRVAGAQKVLETHPRTNVWVLDDGFQHHRVHRDVDLVLVDATCPWGFGHLLPRGLLRERLGGLRRATVVVVTRCDLVSAETLAAIDRRIEMLTGRSRLGHVAHAWAGWRDEAGRVLPLQMLSNTMVAAICGIGRPEAFATQVEAHVGRMVMFRAFPDHHAYSGSDVAAVLESARTAGAQALVMTEKDYVKWAIVRDRPASLPIYRPLLGIRWLDGEDRMNQLLGTIPVGPREADSV